jgi:RNA polymerase sigma factor (sigma-70 family)
MVADVGDEEGRASRLAEVYVRSAPAGFRLAYLLTGDRALAEDLVQEAFLRFVGRLHHRRDPEAFDAYLRRTIVNLSKDLFRRRTLERSYLERRTAELRESHTDRDVAAYESMRGALLSLPPRQRAAIVLRYFEDLHESETPTCCAAGRRPSARSSRAASKRSAASPR